MLTPAQERNAYTAGINACILLVKTRPINDTDHDLIARMQRLLPAVVPTANAMEG